MTSNSNKRQYILNLFSSYGGSIIAAFVGVVSAPISLNYWLVEKYGIWAVITSFTAYLGVSGFGIDTACGILMAKTSSSNEKEKIFKKGLVLLIFSAVVLLLFVYILTYINPEWFHILGKMSEDTYKIASKATLVFIISFFINMPFGIVANAIGAYQRLYMNNLLNAIAPIGSLLILLITVRLKLDMFAYSLLASAMITSISITRLFLLAIARKKYIFNIEEVEDSNKNANYPIIIKTGLRLTLYSLAIMLSMNVGNIIISNKIDVSHVTPYSLSFKIFSLAFMFLVTTNTSAAWLFGKEYSLGNWQWIIKAHRNLLITTLFLGGGIWVGGILFFKPIIAVWVGSVGYAGLPTILFLGGYFFFSGLSNFNYTIINSFNYMRGVWFVSWMETIIFISIALLFIDSLGISSVALGLLTGVVCVTVWSLPLIVKKRSHGVLKYDKIIIFRSFSIVFGMVGLAITNEIMMSETLVKMFFRFAILFLYIALMTISYKEELITTLTKKRNIVQID